MVHNVTRVIAAGWKVYCCVLLFQSFAGKKKRDGGVFWTGGCLLMVLELVVQWLQPDRIPVRAAAVCLAVSVVMHFVFRIPYLMSLVLAMLYYGLRTIAELFTEVLVEKMEFTHVGSAAVFYDDIRMLAGVLILWCGIRVLKKLTKGESYEVLTSKEWGILFVSTFVTVVFFSAIPEIAWQNGENQSGAMLYFAIGILFIDFVVYCMANENMEREVRRREDEAFREKVKSEMAMYRSMSDNLDRQRKRTHEYKNQIAAIGALAAARKYGELDAYIKKIDTALKFGEDVIDTNHVIVNAVLNTKYREAVDKGVSMVLKINDLSKLHMEEEDIVVILSNLLDNAIEACGQSREKVVRLKFILEGSRIILSVENSMMGKPVIKNGKLVTTKGKETKEHGFGVRNVIEAWKSMAEDM